MNNESLFALIYTVGIIAMSLAIGTANASTDGWLCFGIGCVVFPAYIRIIS